jgi:hypothetical protein
VVKLLLVAMILLIVSISVFSYNMGSRGGGGLKSYQQFNLGTATVDEYNIVFSIIPKPLHDTYMYMVYYMAQGYYHTCLAFDLDFEPTYFLGNNPASISLAEIFKIDVWKDTYMFRLQEKGVFYGVPFLLGFIGYLYGISWTLTLNQNDFISKIVFIIFGNMLLYLFANNSYLTSVFYSFIFLLPFWYFTRIKRFRTR